MKIKLQEQQLQEQQLLEKKLCSHCFKIKPKFEFSRDSSRKDGFFPWCKSCTSEYRRKTCIISPRELTTEVLVLTLSPYYIHPKTAFFSSTTRQLADILVEQKKKVFVVSTRANKVWKWRQWKHPVYNDIMEFYTNEQTN